MVGLVSFAFQDGWIRVRRVNTQIGDAFGRSIMRCVPCMWTGSRHDFEFSTGINVEAKMRNVSHDQ